jgi:hypothetical protein
MTGLDLSVLAGLGVLAIAAAQRMKWRLRRATPPATDTQLAADLDVAAAAVEQARRSVRRKDAQC